MLTETLKALFGSVDNSMLIHGLFHGEKERKKERKKEERLGPCNSASALVPIPKSTLVVCIYKVEHTCG